MNRAALLSSVIERKAKDREAIIHVQGNFCNISDADDIPIDDGFIDWLYFNNKAKANDWIARLKDSNATHLNLGISGDYAEPLGWAPRYPIPGVDWTNNLDGFSLVVEWVLNQGFIPIIHLAADGQDYDPVGLTYGWSWAMQNLPSILPVLQKRFPHNILWCTGWDGCFPDHSPEQTVDLLRMMRQVLGDDEQISTEFNGPGGISYCHMGHGPADWTPNKLGILDAFFIEISLPINHEGLNETYGRLLGPHATNCDPAPYFLDGLTKEIAIVDFENIAFQYIRKQASSLDAMDASRASQYYGCKYFGNGTL